MGADPITLGIGGAALGAMMDKKNPLRGAVLGGAGGYFGGPALFGEEAAAAPLAGTGLKGSLALAPQFGIAPSVVGNPLTGGLGSMTAGGLGATGATGSLSLSPSFAKAMSPEMMMQMGMKGVGMMGNKQQPQQQMQQMPQMQAPQVRPMTPDAGGGFAMNAPMGQRFMLPGATRNRFTNFG